MCNTPKFDITELLSLADQALYRAKNLGRNRIERAATEREWRLDETGALFAPPTAKPAMPGL
jgi:hypothetical protein